jgi:hypothetical protein
MPSSNGGRLHHVSVVFGSVGEYLIHVVFSPFFDATHKVMEGQAEVGQFVGDRDWHGGYDGPGEQSVAFERAQGLGELVQGEAVIPVSGATRCVAVGAPRNAASP